MRLAVSVQPAQPTTGGAPGAEALPQAVTVRVEGFGPEVPATRIAAVAAAAVHDALLAGEPWTYTCTELLEGGRGQRCNLVTQGGRKGLAAHQRTVHPGAGA